MTLLRASLLLCLATLVAATEPALVHEARQGPISTTMPTAASDSVDASGPLSQTTSSTSTNRETTMSPTPSTSSTTSATPQPSSSQDSLSLTVPNMTTCTSGLISWKYGGRETDLSLSITNVGVDQYYALFRIKARQDTINTTVLQQLVETDPSVSSWTWPSVNVSQGWYEIQGVVSTVFNHSAPFFVANGTDVTCLASTSTQASSTPSPGTNVSSSAASKTNVAAIAGGVAGGVVGVILVILATIWLCSRRRRRFALGSRGENRKWGSLKSTASSMHPGGDGAPLTGNRFHAHSESTGAIIQVAAGGKVSSPATPDGSEEDVATTGEEKLLSSTPPSDISPVDVLNTPMHYDRRTSIQSLQSPTSVASDPFRSRTGSTHTPNQALEQQAQRIRSSTVTSTRRRSERLSMPTLPSPGLARLTRSPTHFQSKEEYPLSPVIATPIDRSVSTGTASLSARRASRKPVPHYDPSVLLEDTSTSTNTDSISTFTVGGESSSQSHGTGKGTGIHGTPPDLSHKAGFADGRHLHYLIPDMPPPQQDGD